MLFIAAPHNALLCSSADSCCDCCRGRPGHRAHLRAGACGGFFANSPQAKAKHAKPGIYTGDFNLGVFNSTGDGKGTDVANHFFCGMALAEWQTHLLTKGQDAHSSTCTNANGECSSARWLKQARHMLWAGQ